MGNNSIENIDKVVFNSIYADKNSMSEKHQPIVPSMLQHMKVSLTAPVLLICDKNNVEPKN